MIHAGRSSYTGKSASRSPSFLMSLYCGVRGGIPVMPALELCQRVGELAAERTVWVTRTLHACVSPNLNQSWTTTNSSVDVSLRSSECVRGSYVRQVCGITVWSKILQSYIHISCWGTYVFEKHPIFLLIARLRNILRILHVCPVEFLHSFIRTRTTTATTYVHVRAGKCFKAFVSKQNKFSSKN